MTVAHYYIQIVVGAASLGHDTKNMYSYNSWSVTNWLVLNRVQIFGR